MKRAGRQGYNARLDESLGMRNRGPHKQKMGARRRESEGMERAEHERPYSGAQTMDESMRRRHADFMKAAHHRFMADHYKRRLHKKK